MNKLLLKGVAAAFCMATMFGTTACGDDDDLVNVEPPVEETQDVILEGEITSDMTLKAADNNLLRGFVYVTDGVTLTIEPGTVIKGEKSSKGSLIVERGGKLIAVQSENCAPFYETEEQGSSSLVEVTPKPTLAEGIAIGKPARADEVLDMIRRHNVKVITAPEDRILPCREEMAKRGFYVEHTTAAALAAYYRYCEKFGPTEDALLSLCGAGLKSEH